MSDGSVNGRWSNRSSEWKTLIVCGCLLARAAATAAAMPSEGDLTGWRKGGSDPPSYEAYVASRGGVLPGVARLGRAPTETHRNGMIPPFARKYGLPCSACHTVWPELKSLWSTIQRQWLPTRERPRLSDLGQSFVHPPRFSDYSAVATGEHHEPAGRPGPWRSQQWHGGTDGHSVRL